ncbi:hypothetical protein VP01_2975g2 [Puccinia sorghi]|uniref:SNF2 N-terminal domain-containing protein n=1 Tax=Puccinia sorghi TaxID=27349 RepID=A0A0L6V2E5_9BASI|nr:hypothetical protein VP01_2975g2 [Puccinia sorghi]
MCTCGVLQGVTFQEAQVSLTLIWNYDPNVFYNIPQMTRRQHQPSSINGENFFHSSLGKSQATLKHHQCQALQFLLNNGCPNNNKLHDFWMHHDNNWIRETCDQSNLSPEDSQTALCWGSMLADGMGLGKTLTTLMFLLGTSHMARDFHRRNLSNPPVNGRKSRHTSHQGLSHITVWNTNGGIAGCKHGTVKEIQIWPWNQDWIWRQHLIPGMNVGDRHAVQTLNHMMEIVCLRRTKQAILNLPKKVKKAIIVYMAEHWEEYSKELHEKFIHHFGRLWMEGKPWNPTEFFKKLTRIPQYYFNHPMFAREVIPNNGLLNGDQSTRTQPKAVIFSSYVQFLEIRIVKALQQNNLDSLTDGWIL